MQREDFLWTEKFRPKTIEQCILPVELKQTFQQFVNDRNIPNLLLTGKPGVGKTTVARAMLEQLECDYIIINGSLYGNIDTLRNDIMTFASTVSFSGGRKYVIIDEADFLNPNSTQPALRNFMEEFSRNCGFILTCNFKNRILEPIHSRCSVVDFNIPTSERPRLAAQFFKRAMSILEEQNVEYDQKAVAEVVQQYFPDWRRVLNELQRYSATGKIDSGILNSMSDETMKSLVNSMKNRKYSEVRLWVAEHLDIDPTTLFRKFYDYSNEMFEKDSIPQLVVLLADYSYKQGFVADQEINTVACLTEIMVDCKFV